MCCIGDFLKLVVRCYDTVSAEKSRCLTHVYHCLFFSWRYWPSYGSHLAFELVRIRDGPPGADSHVVRVLLDGVPIRSSKVNCLVTHSKVTDNRGPKGMFFINDFEQLVSKLEEAGGYDYASLLGQK